MLNDLYKIEEFDTNHKEALEKYDSLLHLSLNKIGLKNLKNLPRISCLQIVSINLLLIFNFLLLQLELRDNKLDMSDLSEILNIYPRLIKLKIGGNPVEKLENLYVLSVMGELKYLEIEDIPKINDKESLKKIFENLKNIEYVNNIDREGEVHESTIYEDEDNEEIDGKDIFLNFR